MDLKRCRRCLHKLPSDQFHRASQNSDGLSSWCKDCKKSYNANYVVAKSDKKGKHMRSLQHRLFDYLTTHPCVDCGEADILVLQFDHLRDKEYSVTDMPSRRCDSLMDGECTCWARIACEIEKCEVRCANCHVRRTARQGNWERLRFLEQIRGGDTPTYRLCATSTNPTGLTTCVP